MKQFIDKYNVRSIFKKNRVDLDGEHFKLHLLTYFIAILFLASVTSCNVNKKQARNQDFKDSEVAKDTIRIANDSLEYEVIIFEPNFNSWLATQRPRGYYGKTYLEQRNRIFVTNYNIRVNNPSRYDPNLYPQQIDYEFDVDYGYEVNYLLYNYFMYFQQKYRQRLR